MNITIEKSSKLKNMLDTATNKVSNIFTIVVLYLANITKIKAFQRYSERLATKRINKLRHRLIQDRWKLNNLNNAIDCIEKSTTD